MITRKKIRRRKKHVVQVQLLEKHVQVLSKNRVVQRNQETNIFLFIIKKATLIVAFFMSLNPTRYKFH